MFDEKKLDQDVEIKSSSKIKTLIGVFLVLIATAGYVFFTKPMMDNLSVVKAEIAQAQADSTAIKDKIDSYTKAETDLDLSTEVQRREILKAVPTAMNQDEVIRDLVNIAENYNTQLHSISFGRGASGKDKISVLRINASLEGDYNDLTRFLQGIEQNARMLRVNSISVQISDVEGSDIQKATFSLSMEAFFQDSNQ